ncbi:phosphoribosylanthranilate isomerase [Aureispira anguillae]|uniref:N-(5'-phosphoribosyl)anthranilate isomerase n=1 Tax=Aureispira anguillae TaxID=2864201 RepID=A0A915YJR6_9BACT|nr:phosphoribosylanthranilate isomerase [Aureispira anguillae]BDS14488.1 phosphoribosylanthranilate isomerase [Aureispira anguillae]
MKVKVCGMRAVDNLLELTQLNIDFVGFIFYPKSSRYVAVPPVATIPHRIQKVGVFVNARLEEIDRNAEQFSLNYIQLHGDETVEYCQALKAKGYRLIKAFAVDETFDFDQLNAYEDYCDFFLLDAKGKSYGGNGIQFDWQILEHYTSQKHFFLSGGIDLGSINAIKNLAIPQLYGIDINSKFEIAPALKDIPKVQQLLDELIA